MKFLLIALFSLPLLVQAQNKLLLVEGEAPNLFVDHKVAPKENYYNCDITPFYSYSKYQLFFSYSLSFFIVSSFFSLFLYLLYSMFKSFYYSLP
jgi:hypothetical protein